VSTLPSHIAHMRLSSAHFPEPLKAPGATFSRPECPASPSNQLTCQSDFRSYRPIETLPRFAPAASRIGGNTLRPAVFSFRILAIDALIGIRCAGSQGFRPLAPLPFATYRNQRNFTDSLGFIRPFVPSSPLPKSPLRTKRISGLISGLYRLFPSIAKALLVGISPLPDVIGQSDFPWESRSRFFAPQKISLLRVSGTLRSQSISSPNPETVNLIK